MKNLRNVLTALAISIILATLYISASAETYGELTYTVADGEITITGCDDSATDVVIPENIGDYPVTAIGDGAFANHNSITSVTIPESITKVGNSAFGSCEGLEKVFWNADNIADFDYSSYVFYNSGSEENGMEIVFGNNVTKVPAYIFDGCTGLTSVTISESVTSVGQDAFRDCTSLKKVYWNTNNADNSANYYAIFSYTEPCDGFDVIFGNNVTVIPGNVFSGTPVKTVSFLGDVTVISNNAFRGCEILTEITLPETVTTIGNNAFNYCTALESITIPESVSFIGEFAFTHCTALTEINWNTDKIGDFTTAPIIFSDSAPATTEVNLVIGNNVTHIPAYLFYTFNNLKTVTFSDSVKSIGNSAFFGCNNLTEITLPDSLTSIGNIAFFGCNSITTVTIPASVTSIGDGAFANCVGLRKVYWNADKITALSDEGGIFYDSGNNESGLSIIFGDNVTTVPAYFAYHCNYLKNVILSDSVKRIGDYAFTESGIAGVYTSDSLPAKITDIGEYAFAYCRNLSDLPTLSSLENIEKNAFPGCEKLKVITIEESVTTIGENAFAYCTGLQTINWETNKIKDFEAPTFIFSGSGSPEGMTVFFSKNVKNIPAYLFFKCTNLSTIILSESITTINDGTFAWCEGLSGTLNLPSAITSIGNQAFMRCDNLENVVIGENITDIGDYAFAGSLNLKEVTIKGDLDSIGNAAFLGCTSLKTVTIGGNVASFGNNAFENCTALESVTISGNIGNIGDLAFTNCTALESVTISENIGNIGEFAFANCISLKTITFKDNTSGISTFSLRNSAGSSTIGRYAFMNCISLESFRINSGVTEIGKGAFFGTINLKEIAVAEDNANYCTDEYGVLFNKDKTFLIQMPAKADIEKYVLPESTQTVGIGAFFGCENLKDVTFNSDATPDTYTDEVLQNTHSFGTIGLGYTFSENANLSDMSDANNIAVSDGITVRGDENSMAPSYAENNNATLEKAEPSTPSEPEKPDEPDEPTEPEKPDEPDEPQEPEKPAILKGDANGDGKVNAIDARIVLRISAQLDKMENYNQPIAVFDVTGDGKVNAIDARKILRVAAQLDTF